MFESVLNTELHDLIIICSECEHLHDVEHCNNCPTFKQISDIRNELEKFDIDDLDDEDDVYYIGLESWKLENYHEIFAEDCNSAYVTFCEDYLGEDFEPALHGDIVVYKHCLPGTVTK